MKICQTIVLSFFIALPLSAATHPLDPLSKKEIEQAANCVKKSPQFPSTAMFPLIVLSEPSKD